MFYDKKKAFQNSTLHGILEGFFFAPSTLERAGERL
jgi:hypothetical protein